MTLLITPLRLWLALAALLIGSIAGQSGDRAAQGRPAALPACAAFAEGAEWEQVALDGPAPAARRDAALVYDAPRGRLVLFGGRSGAALFDDTWAFDLKAMSWRRLDQAGDPRPAARFSMVAGVDAARDRLLITTGQAGAGQFFNDVWAFDLARDAWAQVATQGTPPAARYGSAGGIAAQGGRRLSLSHGFTDEGRFDDTWALDLETATWQQRRPSGQLPLRRCLHAGAATAGDGLVITGGCASGFGPCPLDDTWRYDGARETWEPIPTAGGPPARQFAGAAALGGCPALLLFGGGGKDGNLDDLWRLDGASWVQLRAAGAAPSPRQGHSVVWAGGLGGPTGEGMLVFGGQGDAGALNELWLLRSRAASSPSGGRLFAGERL